MILVLGTICLDRIRKSLEAGRGLLASSAYGVSSSETAVADSVLTLGGEAANTALALKTWGASVMLEGNNLLPGAGNDLLQDWIENKDVEAIAPFLPVSDIVFSYDGEKRLTGIRELNVEVTIDAQTLPYQGGSWFTADPNLGRLAYDAVRNAEKAGMRIYVMDFNQFAAPIPKGSYVQTSTNWVGGANDIKKMIAWVEKKVKKHQGFTVLTDGPRGFVAGSPTLPLRHYPPFPAPLIIDTSGAGDVFRAGILYGESNAWPIQETLRFAAAAAALSCASDGATADVPDVDQIQAYIAEHPEVAFAYGA